jgi:hypothetical protein
VKQLVLDVTQEGDEVFCAECLTEAILTQALLGNYLGLTREDILACLSYASYLAHEYKAYPIPA